MMWRGRIFVLIFLCASIALFSCDKSENEQRKTALLTQKTMWEVSQFFHRWNIGLSQSKLTTSLEGGGTTRTALGKLSKFTAAAAGIMGSLSAVFAIVMVFLPPQSPELQELRRTYNVMNERLDGISSSLKDINSLMKTATQKATYITHEDAIKFGIQKLDEYVRQVSQITCEIEKDCFRRLISVASQYQRYFDVERSVRAIVRGATENGVFGEALLDLYMVSSKCDLPKFIKFASGIAVLIFRGMVLVSVRGRLMSPNYDSSTDSKYLSSALEKLQVKRQYIEKLCLRDIDLNIKRDLDEHKPNLTTNIQQTNEVLLTFLMSKYPWSDWYITSYISDSGPNVWANISALSGFYTRSEQHNVNSIAWPIIRGSVSHIGSKITATRNTYASVGQHINEIVQNTPTNHIRILASIKNAQQLVMSYIDINNTMKHVYTTGNDNNPMLIRKIDSIYDYLLVYYTPSENVTCTKACNDQGKCHIFPYSDQMFCRCNLSYYGEDCNETKTLDQLKQDAENMLSKSLTIPTISSLKFYLEDSRRLFLLSYENVTSSFTNLNNIINRQFSDLRSFMSENFQWRTTMNLYSTALQNIQALASFYEHYIDFNRFNMTILSNVLGVNHNKQTECERIREMIDLVRPLKLQKWINDVNYLIVGRYDDIFSNHKPLIFMIMDNNKDRLCYPDYKAAIDSAYNQLITLQLQGFLVWDMALINLKMDASTTLDRYYAVIDQQSKALQNLTCSFHIPHSKYLSSCDGVYVHKNMDIKIECMETFYPKEQKRQWVNEVTRYSSQYSSSSGSARQIIGPPNVYSEYRYGGNAWTQAPGKFTEQQFIKLKFLDSVFLEEIRIYEVYNAGAIKQIFVKHPDSRFGTIWTTDKAKVIQRSRIFSPQFESLPFHSDEVMIVLDPSKANGYVAIDAVMIIGRPLRKDERFLWIPVLGNWSSMQQQPQRSFTFNLRESLYIRNITAYHPTRGTIFGIQAFFPPYDWRTISLKERTEYNEESLYLSPEIRFQEQKTKKLRVISYGTDVPYLTAIAIIGLQELQDTCAKMNASACVPCECDSDGSSSSICGINGQCQCNMNYYGKRCTSRDCSVGQWSSWTDCPCGERNNTQSRSRNITIATYGNGKLCPSLNETRDCPYKGCTCTSGFYGPKCQNRHCRLSSWSMWNRDCTTACFDNGEQVRRRTILDSKAGSGRDCGPLEDKHVCLYIRCRTVCRASGGCALQRV